MMEWEELKQMKHKKLYSDSISMNLDCIDVAACWMEMTYNRERVQKFKHGMT